MSISYVVETADSDRVPATGTLPALLAITLRRVRRPAPAPRRDALPLRTHFEPPAAPEPSRYFPAGVLPRTAVPALYHPAPVVDDGPAPDGPALKALRDQAGLTQRQAAALASISCGLVSDLENGRRGIGTGAAVETIRAYVEALQKAIDDAE